MTRAFLHLLVVGADQRVEQQRHTVAPREAGGAGEAPSEAGGGRGEMGAVDPARSEAVGPTPEAGSAVPPNGSDGGRGSARGVCGMPRS